jgi:hypothetical protein
VRDRAEIEAITRRYFIDRDPDPTLCTEPLRTLGTIDAAWEEPTPHVHSARQLELLTTDDTRATVALDMDCLLGTQRKHTTGTVELERLDGAWRVADLVTADGSAVERSFALSFAGAPPGVAISGYARAVKGGGMLGIRIDNVGLPRFETRLKLGPSRLRQHLTVATGEAASFRVGIPNLSWFRRVVVVGPDWSASAELPPEARRLLPSPLATFRQPAILLPFVSLTLLAASLATLVAWHVTTALVLALLSGAVGNLQRIKRKRRATRRAPS